MVTAAVPVVTLTCPGAGMCEAATVVAGSAAEEVEEAAADQQGPDPVVREPGHASSPLLPTGQPVRLSNPQGRWPRGLPSSSSVTATAAATRLPRLRLLGCWLLCRLFGGDLRLGLVGWRGGVAATTGSALVGSVRRPILGIVVHAHRGAPWSCRPGPYRVDVSTTVRNPRAEGLRWEQKAPGTIPLSFCLPRAPWKTALATWPPPRHRGAARAQSRLPMRPARSFGAMTVTFWLIVRRRSRRPARPRTRPERFAR